MEKQKMSKKKLMIFGLIGLFSLVLVTGALVSYLSNQVKADVEVESPIVQEISEGSGYSAGPISFSIHGGESITFWVKTENKANTAITGNGKNIVTNWAGVTCADFASVQARTETDGGGYSAWYTPSCSPGVDAYHVEFAYGPSPSITWSALQIDETEIEVTFDPYAVGDYIFTSQVI